ncbi:MAG: glycine--tRNA ligase subunit beta [Nevskia sp.]|nr:glycine--tRNA ligase subunit beta [Nevskia sp.]
MNDLLIEIGCEDLPARYVLQLGEEFAQAIVAGLSTRSIGVDSYASFATPRRIAVLIPSLADRQPNQIVERKGPKLAAALKDGQPTSAGLGFAKSCGVDFAKLAQEDGQLVFRSKQKGRRTIELIPEIFEDALEKMDALVPKRMRWGAGTETFVRPVEWLLALYGSKLIPLQRFGLIAGRRTYGHRFHAPKAITIKAPADYEAELKTTKVWADFASRRDEIERQIKAEAAMLGGTAKIDQALLDEVTALVEWPVAISGKIEVRFLELPPEVIVATVETNQRYFTVFDSNSKLLPYFITIANIESKDMVQVISGNERVVRPRLSDALFFWQQDLKQPLPNYVSKLATITFQKELGTIAEKVNRILALGRLMHRELEEPSSLRPMAFGDVTESELPLFQAVTMCKSDLATKMVYEFPELQGIMGSYYAARSGYPDRVAIAIREHYLPTQQGTPIPSTREGQIVALADKLDTLAGIFAIGQKPTASKDPYALRRAALGVLRILIEGKLPLDMAGILASALDAQPAGKRDGAMLIDLIDFVMERLRSYYTDRQLPTEMFEAVKSLGITTPLDFDQRVQALRSFWALPAAQSLAAAHKRIRNLLKQAGDAGAAPVNAALFEDTSEQALFATLIDYEQSGLARDDYSGRLAQLASELQAPVDAFFTAVMVMAPDQKVRNNRIALLRRLDAVCREVADISCLPG